VSLVRQLLEDFIQILDMTKKDLSKSASPVLRIIEFVDEILAGSAAKQRENLTIVFSYAAVLTCVLVLWHEYSDRDFSFLITLAGMGQTLGFFLLVHKMKSQRSSAGISSKTLQMYVLVLLFRLNSTLVKNGYLPVDSTGDWAYQACDITSLMLVFQALFYIHKRYKDSYQDNFDTLPVWNAVLPLMGLATVLHGDLNHNWYFDTVWTISMYLDTIAMLPQLWMVVRKGGAVEALTSHYVAMIFFSRFLTFSFWYTGFPELAPENGGFNKMGWLLCGCHGLQVAFSGDFMYHYFKWSACGTKTCQGKVTSGEMVLPVSAEI